MAFILPLLGISGSNFSPLTFKLVLHASETQIRQQPSFSFQSSLPNQISAKDPVDAEMGLSAPLGAVGHSPTTAELLLCNGPATEVAHIRVHMERGRDSVNQIQASLLVQKSIRPLLLLLLALLGGAFRLNDMGRKPCVEFKSFY